MKRRILFWTIIALFAVFVATRVSDLTELARTLAAGNWWWVLAALVLQMGYFTAVAGMYKVGMGMVGVRYRLRDMIPVVLSSIFVSGVTPAGEAGGFALYVDDARGRGYPAAAAAAGALLGQLGYFLGLAVSLVFGFSYLIATGGLTAVAAFGGIAVLVLSGGIVLVLVLGATRYDLLEKLLATLQHWSDVVSKRMLGRTLAEPDWAERTAREFAGAAQVVTRSPGQLAALLGISLLSQVLDIATLTALFLTFGQPINMGVIIATFSLAMALWSVLPFQGIGFVEASMSLVLTGFGLAGGTATVIALSFRGLTFWIPLALGFVTLRRTATFKPAEVPPETRRLTTVRWAGFVAGVLGFISMAAYGASESPARLALMYRYVPTWVPTIGDVATGLLGALLVVLSVGLWKHSAKAHQRVVWVLVALTASNIVRGLEWETAALTAAAAGWISTLGPAIDEINSAGSRRADSLADEAEEMAGCADVGEAAKVAQAKPTAPRP
jgi:uncharacterized protein (TIRG00374 family)